MKNSARHIYISKKVLIDKSKIHGLGVIAKKNIKKGEVVFIIKGEKKIWKIKNESDSLYYNHWIGLGKDLWIDPRGFGRYINHSSNPNCGIKGKVTVCALKKINRGEEVTIDYSITEGDTMWWMEDCLTGRKIKSIQSIPIEKYKKYLPYIPKYFQGVYNEFHNLNEI